jgi:hypothetical protein
MSISFRQVSDNQLHSYVLQFSTLRLGKRQWCQVKEINDKNDETI